MDACLTHYRLAPETGSSDLRCESRQNLCFFFFQQLSSTKPRTLPNTTPEQLVNFNKRTIVLISIQNDPRTTSRALATPPTGQSSTTARTRKGRHLPRNHQQRHRQVKDTSALYVSHTQSQRPQTSAASRAATISHTAEAL
ncbi:hypothetical protein BDZ45DRAFT_746023 [Acephala macrosclerotiorum]|nr:hypothetical protein BDZ45DRAFT_746023 [Acephala macrosclerotiorum]